MIKSFTVRNGLKLNTEKLELLAMCDENSPPDCEVHNAQPLLCYKLLYPAQPNALE